MTPRHSSAHESAGPTSSCELPDDSHKDDEVVGREHVETAFREQFILSGYRRPNMMMADCVRTSCKMHCNETVNVWSHFLAFIYFAVYFCWLHVARHSPFDSFMWPQITFAVGICGFCLMSTLAHTFSSLSVHARHACFFLDYATISVYSVGAGNAFYFYCRPLDATDALFRYPGTFLLLSQAASVLSTVFCCTSRRRWQRWKYVVRTMAFALPFLINSSPYLYRIVLSYTAPSRHQLPSSCGWFFSHCVFYCLSAAANMTRFPERLYPGRFDCFGTSHNLLHVFTALGAAHQFKAVREDMLARKHLLTADANQHACAYTLPAMMVAILINYSIAYFFIKRNKNTEGHQKKELKNE